MLRATDQKRGAQCISNDRFRTHASIEAVIRKIKRLEEWCNYFNLKNKCSQIIEWAENTALRNKPLTIL